MRKLLAAIGVVLLAAIARCRVRWRRHIRGREALATYKEFRGQGDIDAQMAVPHEDLVVIGHPLASGKRDLDHFGYKAIEATLEGEAVVSNIEVDGNTATLDHEWHWQGNCYTNPNRTTITIEDGLIIEWVWPGDLDRTDPPSC